MLRPRSSRKTFHLSHSASPSPPYQAWESADTAALTGWRGSLQEIIFESDTPAGKAFDVALIVAIVLSVGAVMLESVMAVQAAYGELLYAAEWFFTILFTIEYVLRLLSVGKPLSYATSFFGVVDLGAIIPTYLSLLLPGAQYLLVLRLLRVLRPLAVVFGLKRDTPGGRPVREEWGESLADTHHAHDGGPARALRCAPNGLPSGQSQPGGLYQYP